MPYSLHEQNAKNAEGLLAEIIELFWEKPKSVTSASCQDKPQTDLTWLRFFIREKECVFAFSSEKKSYEVLSLAKLLCEVDEKLGQNAWLKFAGITEAPEKFHTFHATTSGLDSMTVLVADNGFVETVRRSTESQHTFQVPFRLSLLLPQVTTTVACAHARLNFHGIGKTAQVLTYFQKGELEMDVREMTNSSDQAQIPVEFVLGEFSMDIEDAFRLRPGDRISIETPESIQGVIRMGGGNWVSAKLSLEDGQAVVTVEKIVREETFNTPAR